MLRIQSDGGGRFQIASFSLTFWSFSHRIQIIIGDVGALIWFASVTEGLIGRLAGQVGLRS